MAKSAGGALNMHVKSEPNQKRVRWILNNTKCVEETISMRSSRRRRRVINFATAFETQTQTQPDTAGCGSGIWSWFPSGSLNAANILRSTCSPAPDPIGNSHSASTHTHTHTSFTLIFQFQRIPDRRTNWQAVRLDRQTVGRTALLSAELGRRVVDCFAMISLRNRKHQMRQIVRLQKDVLWNAPHSLTYLFLYSSAYLKFHCGLKAQYMYSESYSSSPCDLECID